MILPTYDGKENFLSKRASICLNQIYSYLTPSLASLERPPRSLNPSSQSVDSAADYAESTKGLARRDLGKELVVYKGRISPQQKSPANIDCADLVSLDTLPLATVSPYTPATEMSSESMDFTPIPMPEVTSLLSFVEEPSTPSKLHRTFDLHNISDVVSMGESMLPLCHRKSLDFEANEIHELQKRISLDLSLHLVENMLFLSFFQAEADTASLTHLRYWDEDLAEAISSEDYEDDHDMHMFL